LAGRRNGRREVIALREAWAVRIRDATTHDLAAISALYNATIPTTTAAWTEATESLADRQAWFERQQAAGYPTLVADVAGTVVGFTAFGDFRDAVKWPGYRFVVELTVHVAESTWGQGIGRALISELLARAHALGKTQIVAAVDGDNDASLRFHRRLGFVEVARMPALGFKFGRWLDLVLLQRPTAPDRAG
jgi:phosphinothricin acetyltransferase